MTEQGHNSKEQLRSIIERVEAVEADIKDRQADRSDIYKEAGGQGYDVKALRTIIRMRKQDPNDRAEQEAVLETYMQALNMI